MHDAVSGEISVSPSTTSVGGGALYLVLTQVASRGFTFVANQFLLRYLSPSLLGLAVQLELLSVTVLYFGRESLRVALQRQPAFKSKQGFRGDPSQQVVNLAFLAVGLGLCTFPGFGYGYLRSSSTEVFESPHFWSAFKLYAVATFFELISEPCFAVVQQHASYKARARAETTAAMARCVAACLAALIMSKRHLPASVLPFAIGQVSYAAALLGVYLVTVLPMTKTESFSVIPRKITRDSEDDSRSSGFWLGLFSKPLLSLAATFYLQSVFKLLLTNGDSLIISVLTDLDSQGAFALASNYGGLLSRLIFQPVEESSRNVFGRLIASSPPSSPKSNGGNSGSIESIDSRNKPLHTNTYDRERLTEKTAGVKPATINTNDDEQNKQTSTPIHLALTHLTTTLHIYTLFTLPLVTLLPPLLPTLTKLVLPPHWQTPETATLLATYLYYLPFIAVNGVLDAFVTSVATPRQLRTQSLVMAAVTVVYGLVAWTLMGGSTRAVMVRSYLGLATQLGSPGLVLANMVNMALRIAYSVVFVGSWVRQRREGGAKVEMQMWKASLPSVGCVVVAVAVAVALRNLLGAHQLGSSSGGVVVVEGLTLEDVGCVLGGVVVLGVTLLIYEHRFLADLLMPVLPERLASTIRPYLPKSGAKQH